MPASNTTHSLILWRWNGLEQFLLTAVGILRLKIRFIHAVLLGSLQYF